MKTLFDELLAAGVEMSNRESDLYFEAAPLSRDILSRYPLQAGNASHFINQVTKTVWVDVPFEYAPFWEIKQYGKRQPRTVYLGKYQVPDGYQGDSAIIHLVFDPFKRSCDEVHVGGFFKWHGPDVRTAKDALGFLTTDESAKRRYTLIEGQTD